MKLKNVNLNRVFVRSQQIMMRYWLYVGVTLLLCSALAHNTMRYNADKVDKQDIERTIRTLKGEFRTVASMWLDSTRRLPPDYFVKNDAVAGLLHPYDATIYLINNDSLKYWTSSPLVPDSVIVAIKPIDSLIVIGSKIVIPAVIERGNRKAVMTMSVDYLFPYYKIRGGGLKPNTPVLDIKKFTVESAYAGGVPICDETGKVFFTVSPREGESLSPISGIIGWIGIFILILGFSLWIVRHSSIRNVCSMLGLLLVVLVTLRIVCFYTNFPIQSGYLFDTDQSINRLLMLSGQFFSVGNIFITAVFGMIMLTASLRMKDKIIINRRDLTTVDKIFLILICGLISATYFVFFFYVLAVSVTGTYAGKTLYEIFFVNLDSAMIYIIAVMLLANGVVIAIVKRYIMSPRVLLWSELTQVVIVVVVTLWAGDKFLGLQYILIGCNIVAVLWVILYKGRYKIVFYNGFIIVLAGFITTLMFYNDIRGVNPTQKKLAVYLANTNVSSDNTLYSILTRPEEFTESVNENYSFIKYINSDIVGYNNEDIYALKPDNKPSSEDIVVKNNYNHYVYKTPDSVTTVVVSMPVVRVRDMLSIFLYIVILVAIGEFVVIGVWIYLPYRRRPVSQLYSRVRISIMGTVIISTVMILWAVISYSITRSRLSENYKVFNRSYAVSANYLAVFGRDSLPNVDKLKYWAKSVDNEIHVNVNVYNSDGALIVSSSDAAMERYMVPRRINPEAVRKIIAGQNNFIVEEYVGAYTYNSFYKLIKGKEGDVVLQIPMIYSQEALISGQNPLIVNILNVFIIVLSISLIVSMFLYRHIMRPITLITNSIREIKHRRPINIEAVARDHDLEVLINQYNSTIEELAATYRELSAREREGAWKTMARQVAHELKNPLTPIKLKAQMLLRRKSQGDPTWADHVEDTLNTIMTQTDILSDIVTKFASFAKVGTTPLEKTDIDAFLRKVVNLYSGYETVRVIYENQTTETVYANIDTANFWSVITNLVVNAISAIGVRQDGVVAVQLRVDDTRVMISVSDNGPGIPEECVDKIFLQHFTTKTTGSGLGLVLASQIVKSMDGVIYFETQKDVGTTFYIDLNRVGNVIKE